MPSPHPSHRIALITLILLGHAAIALAATEPATTEPPASCVPLAGTARWWTDAHQRHKDTAATGHARVVFIGDSLIAAWDRKDWNTRWAPRGAVNFGISADRTEQVLWRLDDGLLDPINPEVVIVQIGTNNLKSGDIRHSPADTAAGVRTIVQRIRAAAPDARILVMGIFPRQPKYPWIAEAIRQTNARLAALQRDLPGVYVIDLGIHYLGDNGQPSRIHLQDDMLHMKASGYRLWSDSIIDMVDAGLKSD